MFIVRHLCRASVGLFLPDKPPEAGTIISADDWIMQDTFANLHWAIPGTSAPRICWNCRRRLYFAEGEMFLESKPAVTTTEGKPNVCLDTSGQDPLV